jgi:hypothetical protein
MLLGTFLGALIVILAAVVLLLAGKSAGYLGQIKKSNEELVSAQIALGRFVYLEQERQKIKESVNINFTEEQITTLATRISSRVMTILNSEQQNALSKLN